MDVRELVAVGPPLPQSWGSNSGSQAGWQAALPTEPASSSNTQRTVECQYMHEAVPPKTVHFAFVIFLFETESH